MKIEKRLKKQKEVLKGLSKSVEILTELVNDFDRILESLIEEVEEKNKDVSEEEADRVINEMSEKHSMNIVDFFNVFGLLNGEQSIVDGVEGISKQGCDGINKEKKAVCFMLKEDDSYTFYPYASSFTLTKDDILDILDIKEGTAEFIL